MKIKIINKNLHLFACCNKIFNVPCGICFKFMLWMLAVVEMDVGMVTTGFALYRKSEQIGVLARLRSKITLRRWINLIILSVRKFEYKIFQCQHYSLTSNPFNSDLHSSFFSLLFETVGCIQRYSRLPSILILKKCWNNTLEEHTEGPDHFPKKRQLYWMCIFRKMYLSTVTLESESPTK